MIRLNWPAMNEATNPAPSPHPDLAAARIFCDAHELPWSGATCLFCGAPFRWDAGGRPDPAAVLPGVVAVDMLSGRRSVAAGGNADRGATRWVELANDETLKLQNTTDVV